MISIEVIMVSLFVKRQRSRSETEVDIFRYALRLKKTLHSGSCAKWVVNANRKCIFLYVESIRRGLLFLMHAAIKLFPRDTSTIFLLSFYS